MPLPRCFFDLTINGVSTGRVVFELFSNVVPKTAENFRCLCTGEKGEGLNTCKPLHYSGTPVHRIVKGFIIQGGDFSNGDGTGGESIYGGMFKDEGFQLKHDKPFLLSMANKGPNTNGSQFFITTRPAPHLDGIHVIFGHVISGAQFVTEIENQKVDTNHRPYADVRISNSGELVKVSKKKKTKKQVVVESSSDSSSQSESSSESEPEVRKKKRTKKQSRKKSKSSRKKKAKKRKRSPSPSSSSESESDHVTSESDHVSSTMPDEVDLPPDTGRSWLYRRSRTPSPVREKRKNENTESTRQAPVYKSRKKHEVSVVSGRKLKGRGLMRYKTPPRPDDPRRDRSDARDHRSRSRSHDRSHDSRHRREEHRYRSRRSESRERSPRKRRSRRSVSPRRRSRSPRQQSRSHEQSLSPWQQNRSLRQRSRSPQQRRRSPSPRRHSRSSRGRGSRSPDQSGVTKWDRHRDKASSSEDEDMFGVAKLVN